MFNDKYGLTQAVLEGRKTMTRRVVPTKLLDSIKQYAHSSENELCYRLRANATYNVGDIVAIAQSYETLANSGYLDKMMEAPLSMKKEYSGAGYKNKMFVSADKMPHHIKITKVRVEYLQDISDEDCLREGIGCFLYTFGITEYARVPILKLFGSPQKAFAALIDKVSGKGTWDSNPLVWVYEFELVD